MIEFLKRVADPVQQLDWMVWYRIQMNSTFQPIVHFLNPLSVDCRMLTISSGSLLLSFYMMTPCWSYGRPLKNIGPQDHYGMDNVIVVVYFNDLSQIMILLMVILMFTEKMP